jgi:hypothetical protein
VGFIQTSLYAQVFKDIFRNSFLDRIAGGSIAVLLLSGCGTPTHLPASPMPTASPPLPAAVSEVTAERLSNLVILEREASITGNLPLLATLWSEDARIVDGRGTPATSDDYVWNGRAAILDRYTLAVFPAPPPPLARSDLAAATLTVADDEATLINGGDRWHFVHQDGRWWLQGLTYSAP